MFPSILGVILLLSAAAGALAADDALVRLSWPLQFEDGAVEAPLSAQDVAALMRRPLSRVELTSPESESREESWARLLLDGEEEAEEVTPREVSTREVHTCQEYLELRDQGWLASSNFDRRLESSFIETCGLLGAVSRACPVRTSYVDDPRVGVSDLALLPPTALPGLFHEEAERLKRLDAEGHTVADLIDRDAEFVLKPLSASYEYGGWMQTLVEEARGDFNCDGIEDLWVHSYVRAVGGTYRASFNLILTRRAPDAMFKASKFRY